MPGRLKRLLALVLVAVLCSGLTAAAEERERVPSARDVVRLFPQHQYWLTYDDCSWLCYIRLEYTTKTNTMCTSGCMIWAFVHAVEWCLQTKLDYNGGSELAQEFIDANPQPWNMPFWSDETYHNVVRAHGIEVLSELPETEEELLSLFEKTGVVVCNMGGHCTVAIGHTYFDYDQDGDEDMMLHMIDSALWSSAKKQECYAFTTGKKITYTATCAGEFWLPLDTYLKLDRLAMMPMPQEEAPAEDAEAAGDASEEG